MENTEENENKMQVPENYVSPVIEILVVKLKGFQEPGKNNDTTPPF